MRRRFLVSPVEVLIIIVQRCFLHINWTFLRAFSVGSCGSFTKISSYGWELQLTDEKKVSHSPLTTLKGFMINGLFSTREHFSGMFFGKIENKFLCEPQKEAKGHEKGEREIELAIIHSFVNNDKWRLFYVYLSPIEERRKFQTKISERRSQKRRNEKEFFSPSFLYPLLAGENI